MNKTTILPPALLLLAAVFLGACSDNGTEAEQDTPVRPPVLIDEDTITRMIAAMRELQDLSRAHPLIESQGEGGLDRIPIGMGITAILGEDCFPILKKHGFPTARAFESYLGYTQVALNRLMLESIGGFGGEGRAYRLNLAIQDTERQLSEAENDSDLSNNDRSLQMAELRLRLESLNSQLEETHDFADVIQDGFDNVPAENIEVVSRHQEELLALMRPGQ